jgi:N4-gp56 family major capsid protein
MLFLGDGAYGDTEVTGGGLEVILKQQGSAGTADALNQRSSVGWKATKTAKILVEDYIIRAECTCKHSNKVFAPN